MSMFTTDFITPANFTESARILGLQKNRKGFADNTVVYLHHRNLSSTRMPGRQLNVIGGTEEMPVRILVESGMNTVNVLEGHVEITSDSIWGNVVHANAGATVTIKADAGRKVTVSGHGKVIFRTDNTTNRLRDCTANGVDIRVLELAS